MGRQAAIDVLYKYILPQKRTLTYLFKYIYIFILIRPAECVLCLYMRLLIFDVSRACSFRVSIPHACLSIHARDLR